MAEFHQVQDQIEGRIYQTLPPAFYARDTARVAIDLLGKYLVHEVEDNYLVAKIVETEAYLGEDDPASHAATKKKTERSAALYQPPGISYVYIIYGLYHCFNVVAHPRNEVGAVLVRAVQPIAGIEQMRRHRQREMGERLVRLTNGPGKLCQSLRIDLSHNRMSLYQGSLTLRQARDEGQEFEIGRSVRVGISKAKNAKLRFFVVDNAFVSDHRSIEYEIISRRSN